MQKAGAKCKKMEPNANVILHVEFENVSNCMNVRLWLKLCEICLKVYDYGLKTYMQKSPATCRHVSYMQKAGAKCKCKFAFGSTLLHVECKNVSNCTIMAEIL